MGQTKISTNICAFKEHFADTRFTFKFVLVCYSKLLLEYKKITFPLNDHSGTLPLSVLSYIAVFEYFLGVNHGYDN